MEILPVLRDARSPHPRRPGVWLGPRALWTVPLAKSPAGRPKPTPRLRRGHIGTGLNHDWRSAASCGTANGSVYSAREGCDTFLESEAPWLAVGPQSHLSARLALR